MYEVLRENDATLTADQASQAVITIRDLQRSSMSRDDVPPDLYGDASAFFAKKFNAELKEAPEFNTLLQKVSNHPNYLLLGKTSSKKCYKLIFSRNADS